MYMQRPGSRRTGQDCLRAGGERVAAAGGRRSAGRAAGSAGARAASTSGMLMHISLFVWFDFLFFFFVLSLFPHDGCYCMTS